MEIIFIGIISSLKNQFLTIVNSIFAYVFPTVQLFTTVFSTSTWMALDMCIKRKQFRLLTSPLCLLMYAYGMALLTAVATSSMA